VVTFERSALGRVNLTGQAAALFIIFSFSLLVFHLIAARPPAGGAKFNIRAGRCAFVGYCLSL